MKSETEIKEALESLQTEIKEDWQLDHKRILAIKIEVFKWVLDNKKNFF